MANRPRKQFFILVGLIILVFLGGTGIWFWIHPATHSVTRQTAVRTWHGIAHDAHVSAQQRHSTKTQFDRETTSQTAPKLATKVTQQLKAKHFVGTALVVKNNRVVYQRAFGWANREQHRKNTTTTPYLINSTQKALTGQLIMRAVQDDQLSLNDHLSQYYPKIKHSRTITIRQMLNMTAGIYGTVPQSRYLSERAVYHQAATHAKIDTTKIGQFDYQPIDYTLLAGILHQVTHQSYYQRFYQQIVTPLNLNHTKFAEVFRHSRTMTVSYTGSRPGLYQTPHIPAAAPLATRVGTGNVMMSAGDLFRAERAVIQGKLLLNSSGAQTLHQAKSTTAHYTGGLYHLGQSGYYGHGLRDNYEATFVLSRNGKTGVVFLSNSFTKATMWPTWSTEKTAISLFKQVDQARHLN